MQRYQKKLIKHKLYCFDYWITIFIWLVCDYSRVIRPLKNSARQSRGLSRFPDKACSYTLSAGLTINIQKCVKLNG